MDQQRTVALNRQPLRPDGEFVLYWMTAARRLTWNFALERAAGHAQRLNKPLVILEALRCGYQWASDRLHQFILDGMADNQRQARGVNALYYPYVEPAAGAGKGLIAALAGRACAVVTDDFPCFMLPRMAAAAAQQSPVLMEAVDANGIVPIRAAEQTFVSAYQFRRHLQRVLPGHLLSPPSVEPLAAAAGLPRLDALPADIARRWPPGLAEAARLPVDHAVPPAPLTGGTAAGAARLQHFIEVNLDRYADGRNTPDDDRGSGLSPYLHFGHISASEIVAALTADWSPENVPQRAGGHREGWWGLPPPVEAFLDQLITWRELAFNFCAQRADYAAYDALPGWAQQTLEQHASDPRPYLYTTEELEQARTHDPLWNAAQRQLLREGRIHNYLRMLWGKKILEWTPGPREAARILMALNDKYALDGRDPNSYAGIFWCLGRYDRPWGPERPVFGKIRYMTSANTARKVSVKKYLEQYGP